MLAWLTSFPRNEPHSTWPINQGERVLAICRQLNIKDNHVRGETARQGRRRMNRKLATPWKPTKAQILAAHDKIVPDLAAKNLIVLFAGINPGLYTAAIGHHFGRPGNRFWPALHGGGFTPRLFSPFEESLLLELK